MACLAHHVAERAQRGKTVIVIEIRQQKGIRRVLGNDAGYRLDLRIAAQNVA